MTIVVPDASVILKWVLQPEDEPGAARALQILEAFLYDAAYHVLAIRTDGLFVTADRKYLARAGRKGHVTLLADWLPPAQG